MQLYANNIQDTRGNAIAGAQVAVTHTSSGASASIYSDDGVTPLANPFLTDAEGEFEFYAAAGTYTVTVTSSLLPAPKVLAGINLFDGDAIAGDIAAGDAAVLADLASTASGEGAGLSGFDWAVIPAAIKRADWGIQTASNGYNILRLITPSEWAGVIAGTTTYDASAAFSTAAATGRVIYAPSGTYLLDIQNLPSSTVIEGDGENTIFKPLTDDVRCALGADSGSSSAWIENIEIRRVKFLGNVAGAGFSEQKHLTSFNGVKNLLLDRVHFVGFRGDGFYLGSGNGVGEERHNLNVKIINCVFDGVNKDNRNAISVIDVDGLEAYGNTFTRCTRSDMPAALDIEPNNYAFHVLKNIHIHDNTFDDVKSGILVTNSDLSGRNFENIHIHDNTVKNFTDVGISTVLSHATTPLAATDSYMDISVHDNYVSDGVTPFELWGVIGAKAYKNTFKDCDNAPIVGNGSFTRLLSFEVEFKENVVEDCGLTDPATPAGVVFDGITNLSADWNTFIDCGDNIASSGCGVWFKPSFSGAVSLKSFTGNKFRKASLTNMDAVRLTNSTITYDYDKIHSNEFNSLASIFLADSGSWTPGITFATPGDLSVAYSVQYGTWRRNGKSISLTYSLTTSSFTHTTASSVAVLSGFPANNIATAVFSPIAVYQGITKASFTSMSAQVRPSSNTAWLWASGSAQTAGTLTTTNLASGGSVVLAGQVDYKIQT